MSRSLQQTATLHEASIQRIHIPPPPTLQLSETAHGLVEIINTHPLPSVIKGTGPTRDVVKSNLDTTQPLLAYTKRSVRKVSAHSLQFDPVQCDFMTVGNGILIPEDYPGWFAVIGTPDTITHHHQRIPHYTMLSYLFTSRCNQFLIGGRDSLRAVVVQRDHYGNTVAIPYQILPGTVLRRGGLYREEISVIKDKKKKKKKTGPHVPCREFLKCFDIQGREMFLHIHQKGTFYILSRDDAVASPQILQIKDILNRLQFPIVVRLIYGRVPITPCAFTQVMLLTDSGISHTLVASTLLCYHNFYFEIPVGIDMKFHIAKHTASLTASKAYINALETCHEKVPNYVRDMKVIFGYPRLEHEKMTRKTNQPDTITQDNKSVPVALPSDPVMRRDLQEHVPKQSANIISRTSYLSRMSQLVTVNEDNFILADQPSQTSSPSTKPQNYKSTAPENAYIDAPSKMTLIKMYDPPNHTNKMNQIAVNQSHGHLPVSKLDNGDQIQEHGQREGIHENMCDSNHAHSNARCEVASIKSGLTSTSLPENSQTDEPKPDELNVYSASWRGKQTLPSITNPSKVCQPIIPGRSPMVDREQLEYLPMHSKTTPKTSILDNKILTLSTSQLSPSPPLSESPQKPERGNWPNGSQNRSVNDSDSIVSVSEGSYSLSDWNRCEINNYISMVDICRLTKVEIDIPEDDQQKNSHQKSQQDSANYVPLQDMTNPPLCNTTTASASTAPLQMNGEHGTSLAPMVPVQMNIEHGTLPTMAPMQMNVEHGRTLAPMAPMQKNVEHGTSPTMAPVQMNVEHGTSLAPVEHGTSLAPMAPMQMNVEHGTSLAPMAPMQMNVEHGTSLVPMAPMQMNVEHGRTPTSMTPLKMNVEYGTFLAPMAPLQMNVEPGRSPTSMAPLHKTVMRIRNDYLDPVDVVYLKSEQPNGFAKASTTIEHVYSQPEGYHTASNNIDGDGHGYTVLCEVNQSNDSLDTFNAGVSTNNGLQLSSGSKYQLKKLLGNSACKPTPALTSLQSNKDSLIMELRKTGIKPSTESALADLQWADIVNLLSREDDFDDALVALLPNVSQIDLKTLAICLRGIRKWSI